MGIAIITGGSRGLGKNMALQAAAHGHDIILTYRTKKLEAEEVVLEIQKLGRRAASLELDVAHSVKFPEFAEHVGAILHGWGAVAFDFLINNAGIGVHASYAETTEAQFDELVSIHLKAPFFLTQRLLPLIQDGGRIINVSTGLTRFTFPGYAAYASMKGGVEVLTHYMAKELGARGITVNVLAPGAIETDFGGGVVRDNADLNKMIASMTALGRVGLPDDIGGVLAMLLAPESRWVSGQRIEASGGMLL